MLSQNKVAVVSFTPEHVIQVGVADTAAKPTAEGAENLMLRPHVHVACSILWSAICSV